MAVFSLVLSVAAVTARIVPLTGDCDSDCDSDCDVDCDWGGVSAGGLSRRQKATKHKVNYPLKSHNIKYKQQTNLQTCFVNRLSKCSWVLHACVCVCVLVSRASQLIYKVQKEQAVNPEPGRYCYYCSPWTASPCSACYCCSAIKINNNAKWDEMRRRQWLMDSVSSYFQYQNPRTEAAATDITIKNNNRNSNSNGTRESKNNEMNSSCRN